MAFFSFPFLSDGKSFLSYHSLFVSLSLSLPLTVILYNLAFSSRQKFCYTTTICAIRAGGSTFYSQIMFVTLLALLLHFILNELREFAIFFFLKSHIPTTVTGNTFHIPINLLLLFDCNLLVSSVVWQKLCSDFNCRRTKERTKQWLFLYVMASLHLLEGSQDPKYENFIY